MEGYYDQTLNGGPGFTRANYVGCFSADGTTLEPEKYDPGGGAGTCHLVTLANPSVASGKRAFFNFNVARSSRNITDGLSKTIAASELISPGDGAYDWRGVWWLNQGSAYTHRFPPNAAQPDLLLSACVPQKTPCTPTAPCWGATVFAARSYHRGGVNVLIGDGAVTFVADTIDMPVWQGMGSIASGETVRLP